MPVRIKRYRLIRFLFLLTVACVLFLTSCNNSSSPNLITFRRGFYCKSDTGNSCAFYLVYDLHADSKQTYKMPSNGDMMYNATLEFDDQMSCDLSWSTLSKSWEKAFGEHGRTQYEEGCDRDIILAAGTDETISCASVFSFMTSTTPNKDSNLILTSHLLPEEQTVLIPFSSLQEVSSLSEIHDLLKE